MNVNYYVCSTRIKNGNVLGPFFRYLTVFKVQASQDAAEERSNMSRKIRDLAKTPHTMLLTRIQQLVSGFGEVAREMASVKAVLESLEEAQASLGALRRQRSAALRAIQPL
jgi:vacuolar-type H+-ATPase subunit D/Vma8